MNLALHVKDFTEQPDKEKVSKHTLESDEELEEDEEGGRMNDEELKGAPRTYH